MNDSADSSIDLNSPPGRARRSLLQLLADSDIRPHHPPAVTAEAERIAQTPGIDDPALTDLTHLALVTIDEVHSRDLDQALFIERAGDGYVVWYALADASWYVRRGTALWDEALKRGSSYYLPGLVAPMLPKVLSEGIISLNEGVDRRALTFRMTLNAAGECVATEVIRGRVHSRAKLDYDGVQGWMDTGAFPGPLTTQDPAVLESLRLLAEVGELRMSLADERGVVRFRRTSVSVSLEGARGMRFVAWTDPRNDIERYNEQISLMTNVEGARNLSGGASLSHPIYRVHEAPKPERVLRMKQEIEALIEAHALDPAVWRWDGDEPLAAYLDRLPHDGPLADVARVVHRQAIVSNGRAMFTDVPGRHHGIGAEMYARFTAPMREIVGIFLHEEACEVLEGRDFPVPEGAMDDAATRDAVIEAAMSSKQRQRRLDKIANRLVLDQIFGDDVSLPEAARPLREGLVMGRSRDRFHVLLDDPGIDVKVYLRHQPEGAPVPRVGDRVQLRVSHRDPEQDRWALAMV